MFGIGGGELVFILFIVLMLFGSDKIPELARALGKGMAQLKNATNEIKSEIHKGMDDSGIPTSMTDITGNINAEISKARQNLIGDAPAQMTRLQDDIVGDLPQQINQANQDIEELTGPIKRQR